MHIHMCIWCPRVPCVLHYTTATGYAVLRTWQLVAACEVSVVVLLSGARLHARAAGHASLLVGESGRRMQKADGEKICVVAESIEVGVTPASPLAWSCDHGARLRPRSRISCLRWRRRRAGARSRCCCHHSSAVRVSAPRSVASCGHACSPGLQSCAPLRRAATACRLTRPSRAWISWRRAVASNASR